MANRIGIDIGTANLRVYVREKGVVLRMPSVIATNRYTDGVLATGRQAREMLGKTPGNIHAARPLRGGVIADGDLAARLLSEVFRMLGANSVFSRPGVILTVPSGATVVERRALEDAAYDAGAKSVTLCDAAIAAAIGAGIRVGNPHGSMLVDVGAGTTEAAVLSLGGVVSSACIRTAGDAFDAALADYLRTQKNVLVGDLCAEGLKRKLGASVSGVRRDHGEAYGRDLTTGLAVSVHVTTEDSVAAFAEPVADLCAGVKRALEDAPPELSSDVLSAGLVLSGGSVLLPGLPEQISKTCGVRVVTCNRPLDAAITGIGRILEDPARFEKLLRGK